MVKVEIEGYCNRPELHPYMPNEVFNKLEATAVQGEDSVELSRGLFERMVTNYKSEKKR